MVMGEGAEEEEADPMVQEGRQHDCVGVKL